MAAPAPRRDPLVILGLGAVALAAAVSSFTALYGVALVAGWSRTMAPMFPITIDASALVATRIWLGASTPTEATRRFARSVAIGAMVVSLLGNGVFHLAAAHVIEPGVWVVIAAGAVPPIALAVVCHLAVLRSAAPAVEAPTATVAASVPVVEPVAVAVPVAAQASAEPVMVVDTVPDTSRTAPRTPRPVDTATKVARIKARYPDMSAADLAMKIGVSDRTVRRHLAMLTTN